MRIRLGRRDFAARLAAGIAGVPFALSHQSAGAALTAAAIVDRIRRDSGVPWKEETVDGFKAGDPAAVVTGIITTALPTMDVLTRAVAVGANLVITSAPTFYSRADTPTPPPRKGPAPGGAGREEPGGTPDPVFAAKDAFVRKSGLVVWRYSDHWRLRRPDPLAQGLIEALGWASSASADSTARVSIPDVSLEALAAEVKKRLDARGGIRVIGRPDTRVRTVGVLPGSTPIQASLAMLPSVDVIVAGEVREWESVEYVRDTVTADQGKGMILVGRILSESHGMRVCAQWLTTLVPELRTTWIPATDPYWRPM